MIKWKINYVQNTRLVRYFKGHRVPVKIWNVYLNNCIAMQEKQSSVILFLNR